MPRKLESLTRLLSISICAIARLRAESYLFNGKRLKINSTQLVEKLIHEKSVLIVPGDHFEMDRHLRFGFGSESRYLKSALPRIEEALQELN